MRRPAIAIAVRGLVMPASRAVYYDDLGAAFGLTMEVTGPDTGPPALTDPAQRQPAPHTRHRPGK
ncbi:hypothetical protein [Streptomyces inhibens]|uniref:hypothetical protein n=1 Tax=Streptomyces inhibens TaxID=2293571 RepID=UPI001EE714D1|nr:hypothetical protein [Streptomyces inhibens]UKY47495.1 hypothetical protein KI385_00615 [Streptomyces inhibens]